MRYREWEKIAKLLDGKRVYCEYYNGDDLEGPYNHKKRSIEFVYTYTGKHDFDYVDYKQVRIFRESD